MGMHLSPDVLNYHVAHLLCVRLIDLGLIKADTALVLKHFAAPVREKDR